MIAFFYETTLLKDDSPLNYYEAIFNPTFNHSIGLRKQKLNLGIALVYHQGGKLVVISWK